MAEVEHVLDLVTHAEDHRVELNTVRPHKAIAWNRPFEVYTGLFDPLVPKFPEPSNLPAT